MNIHGHDDSDRALDSILATGEAEELDRIQAGLNIDVGLAAITQCGPHVQSPLNSDDSGEPRLLTDAGHQSRSPRSGFVDRTAGRCVLVAVDIAGYSARSDRMQNHARAAFYDVLTRAFDTSGAGWEQCYREDRGDGALILVPDEVPMASLLHRLVDQLRAGLARHNRQVTRATRIRMRVAVHSGVVQRDRSGITGAAVLHPFRLLDAPVLRKALADSGGDLGVIVSDYFYESVIRQRACRVDPMTYRPVRVAVKETRTRAWLHLPQSPAPSPRQDRTEGGVLDVKVERYESPELRDFIPVGAADAMMSETVSAAEIVPFRWERQ